MFKASGSWLIRCPAINCAITSPKCQISRNGISRYSLSRACRSVSDTVSIVSLSLSFFTLLFSMIFLPQATPWSVTFAQIRRAIGISVSILLKPANRDRIPVLQRSNGAVSIIVCALYTQSFFEVMCDVARACTQHVLYLSFNLNQLLSTTITQSLFIEIDKKVFNLLKCSYLE